MKKTLLIVLVLSLMFNTVACSGGSANDQILKSDIVDMLDTGIEAEFTISDEDYNKYNEIMDYLYDYPEKSEAELFEELTDFYGGTAVELKKFVEDNVLNAIARDMAGNTVTEKDVDNLVYKFIEENIISDSVSINSINSEIQGVGTISKVDFKINRVEHNLIVKFRFSDNYKTARVTQIKLDGLNIDY